MTLFSCTAVMRVGLLLDCLADAAGCFNTSSLWPRLKLQVLSAIDSTALCFLSQDSPSTTSNWTDISVTKHITWSFNPCTFT